MAFPDFLVLPARAVRPRQTGLTHVLDNGVPLGSAQQLLAAAGRFIDIWKFGWGTAYLDPELAQKLRLLHQHGIRACLGGTLMEIAWGQGKVDECLEWAAGAGVPLVEVSRGVMPMSADDKTRLVRKAAVSFTVLTEVGSKDPARQTPPDAWADEVKRDLDAGAWLVVTEGRESGTVGTFDAQGGVIEPVVDAVVGVAGAGRILFRGHRQFHRQPVNSQNHG